MSEGFFSFFRNSRAEKGAKSPEELRNNLLSILDQEKLSALNSIGELAEEDPPFIPIQRLFDPETVRLLNSYFGSGATQHVWGNNLANHARRWCREKLGMEMVVDTAGTSPQIVLMKNPDAFHTSYMKARYPDAPTE